MAGFAPEMLLRIQNALQQLPPFAGQRFWVDPVNGNNNNGGRSPSDAFATTPYALTQCVNNRGDQIIRLPGNELVVATMALNIARLAIIGMPMINPEKPEEVMYYWAAATGPIFQVTQPVHLKNLEICAAWVGTQVPLASGCDLVLQGEAGGMSGSFNHIEECSFPGWGEFGGISLEGSSFNLIEKCLFETGLTDGIMAMSSPAHNPVNNRIKNCRFEGPTNGIASRFGGTPQDFLIDNNEFYGNMTNALNTAVSAFGGNSGFMNNRCSMLAANAMNGNRAAMEGEGVFAAGNFYRDQADPRA